MMIFRSILVAAVSVGCGACADDSDQRVSQDQTTGRAPAAFVLADSPSAVIGDRDDAAHQLTFPVAALQLDDGRIVVAESSTRDLRFFDRTGDHVGTAGGEGQGPGEMGGLRSIGRLGDGGVWAWDPRARRVHFFAPSGETSGSVSVSVWPEVARSLIEGRPRSGANAYDVHAFDDRTVVIKPLVQPMLSATGVVRDTVPLVVVPGGGDGWSTVRPLDATDEWLIAGGIAGMLPLGDRVYTAGGTDVVYVASAKSGMIARITPGTEGVDTIAPEIAPRPVTGSDARAIQAENSSHSTEYGDAIPIPEFMPLLAGLKIGLDGSLWAKEYEGPTDRNQRWVRVGPAGEVSASLTIDAGVTLLDVGSDFAIVRTTNMLDVPEIRLYPMVPAR